MPLAGRRINLTTICLITLLTTSVFYALTMPFRQHFQSVLDKAEQAFQKIPGQPIEQIGDKGPAVPISSKPPPYSSSSSSAAHPSTHTRTPYWRPTFDPSASVSTHFTHEVGQHGWGNAEAQNYVAAPANSFHSPSRPSNNNNTLVLRALIDSSAPTNAQRYTSARLSSHQTLSRPRGCLSAHITAPVARGIWPAFWLLPTDPFVWPTDGEVDIFEAWDGDAINHSCLHWGFFDGNDWDKHRVIESEISRIGREGHFFEFAWTEDESSGEGRLVWYIDGRPVMRARKPAGTRRLSDFRILINIAVGGNVCKGHMPGDGVYEMRVGELAMWDAPPRGWEGFEADWKAAREGHPM